MTEGIHTAALALARTLNYSTDKTERMSAIRALGNLVRDSHVAANALSTHLNYTNDEDERRAALVALGGNR
jgi:hypothetical protein